MNRALALEEQSPAEPPLFIILNKGTMTSYTVFIFTVTSQNLRAKKQEDKDEEGSLFRHPWPYGHHKYKVTFKTHAK
jgi:hypothetical protein